MNINTAFPSKFLKGAELEDDTVYTMLNVEQENVGGGDNDEVKPVLYFEETDKGLVLNRTNSNTIAGLYGPETDEWAGKQITLFQQEVDFQGKQTLAIRVRMKKPGATPGKTVESGFKTKASEAAGKSVMAARSEAWQAFIDMTPSYDEGERKTKWAEALKGVYVGVPERSMTAEQWKAFGEKVREFYDEVSGDFLPM